MSWIKRWVYPIITDGFLWILFWKALKYKWYTWAMHALIAPCWRPCDGVADVLALLLVVALYLMCLLYRRPPAHCSLTATKKQRLPVPGSTPAGQTGVSQCACVCMHRTRPAATEWQQATYSCYKSHTYVTTVIYYRTIQHFVVCKTLTSLIFVNHLNYSLRLCLRPLT